MTSVEEARRRLIETGKQVFRVVLKRANNDLDFGMSFLYYCTVMMSLLLERSS